MNEPRHPPIDAAGEAEAADVPRFVPLYVQIKRLLTQGLRAGEWGPGEAIPSEVELARRYGVSQGTVRKAIDELAAENLVVRRQGRGTFVASHHEARTQFRFLRLRPDDDGDVGQEALGSRIIECRRLRPPVEVGRVLALRAGETAVCIRRVLDLRGEPTVLDEIWLPGGRFRGLTAERLAAYGGPLYGLFEREFGTRMIRAAERVKAVAADAPTAALLRIEPGSPLLQVERVSRSYDDVPVEFRRGLYVTNRHHYANELN
jgi:GntR family transcriptional regulator